MLDVKALLAKIFDALKADYVVEQGTSGIWTYRKWNNGIAECWGEYSKTASIAASGHISISAPKFPDIFITTPIANATGGGQSSPNIFVTYQRCNAWSDGYAIDAYWRNMAGSAFNNTAWVYISAKGKWKSGGVVKQLLTWLTSGRGWAVC